MRAISARSSAALTYLRERDAGHVGQSRWHRNVGRTLFLERIVQPRTEGPVFFFFTSADNADLSNVRRGNHPFTVCSTDNYKRKHAVVT